MLDHPFTRFAYSKIVGVTLFVVAVLVLWSLLALYAPSGYYATFVDSFSYLALLALAGYFGWFFVTQVSVWQAQAGVALLVQLLCLGVSFAILTIVGLIDRQIYLSGFPLRLAFGLLLWILLILWYKYLLALEKEDASVVEEVDMLPLGEDLIDRISVKDGSRIHIIKIEELFCIQASGDYAMLCTSSGQYIKEQTMKYYEAHLPPSVFIRIHRSTIVNTNHIMRVELFEKETYQVRLKNGTCLRVSAAGYKLLRKRLGL